MITIISMCLVVTAGLIAVSQYFKYAPHAASDEDRFRYMFLCLSLSAAAVVQVCMVLSFPGTLCYILYALEKFLKVLMMGEIVLLTQNMVDVEKKYTSSYRYLLSKLYSICYIGECE